MAQWWRAPEQFRPAGSPAGTWPHTPWHVCEFPIGPRCTFEMLLIFCKSASGVFHDPYERINFWSHFVPGVVLICIGIAAWAGQTTGGWPMVIYCAAAATTHLCSAITHIWPDDHLLVRSIASQGMPEVIERHADIVSCATAAAAAAAATAGTAVYPTLLAGLVQEKMDHLGIVALILGTPLTAAVAQDPEVDLRVMLCTGVGLLAAAFLRPLMRTLAFVGLGAVLFFTYYQIVNINLGIQVAMYLCGAYSFVRNKGHERWPGLTDHHLLHYWVSLGCCLHLMYIRDAVMHRHATLA
ncbi:hypothetical protein QJQ45_016254 [Haematococcus lacustris]|nr:hypothetical protein QJQ45_016254 [Haematococcus lacustris]